MLGALFGRKLASVGNVGRAGSTVRRTAKIRKEKQDVAKAKEKIVALRRELAALEKEFQASLESSKALVHPDAYPVTTKALRPRKSDIDVRLVGLYWA